MAAGIDKSNLNPPLKAEFELRNSRIGASRSSAFRSLTLFDQLSKTRKQRRRIVGPRRGFRVILHTKDGLPFVAQAFNGLVVQVNAVDCNFPRQARGIDRETMILRG